MLLGLRLRQFLVLSIFLIATHLQADNDNKNSIQQNYDEKDKDKKEAPPRIGNFALPPSQQPTGLFAFGGNIVVKGKIQVFLFADAFFGKKRIVSDVIPSILFGITNDFSVLFNFPFTPEMRDDNDISKGLEDFYVQFEYAFYSKTTSTYEEQATLVANITTPTGSINKNPITGYGSPSFFIGATYYRTWVDWFAFTCQGAILTTTNHRTKLGDQFLYQWGVGRNIPSPKGRIYAWMVELDGQYYKKNRINGALDSNSGGNVFYITPSLWYSSKTVELQFGVSLPLTQNPFGKQHKFDYALNFNFAWTYYD